MMVDPYTYFFNWMLNHPAVLIFGPPCLWVFLLAVNAMPSPAKNTGFYRWVFDFFHLLTGALSRISATRLSNMLSGVSSSSRVPTSTELTAQTRRRVIYRG